MIRYRFDVLRELKRKGYNTGIIREKKILGQKTLHLLRRGELVSLQTVNLLCGLLMCDVGDLLEYIPDDPDVIPDTDQKGS